MVKKKIKTCACPKCGSSELQYHTTAASEIYGSCWQTGWIECAQCEFEAPSVQITDFYGLNHRLSVDGFQRALDQWELHCPTVAPTYKVSLCDCTITNK